MKKIFLILFVFSLSYTTLCDNLPSTNSIAIISKFVKEVSFKKSKDSDIEKAKIGAIISDGGQVITKSKSLAIIKLTKDNSLLTVRENSVLNIYERKDGRSINTSANIDKGTVSFNVKKQNVEDGFEFITPSAVASIRGTSGLLNVDSTETDIFLEDGEIFVQFKDDPNKNSNLTAGKKLKIDKDGNIFVKDFNEDDKKVIEESKKTNTKKISIITPYGILEIEYLSD